MMNPRISIGMFVHDEERHIRETIESLLTQTHKTFQLVILDDCSTDATADIVKEYARRDPRISCYRNGTVQGYIRNYQKTFILSQPCEYFAWAAGHDVYHPQWLEKLTRVLEQHHDAVLAYPMTVRISETGKDLHIPSPCCSTDGLGLEERVRMVTLKCTGFGNMIYGLFRSSAIKRAGIFPAVLLPDVTFLSELSLYGSFHQIKEELWSRRYYSGTFDLNRQRRVAFGTTAPWYTYLPWPIVNTIVLFWHILANYNGQYARRLGWELPGNFLRRHRTKIRRDYRRLYRYALWPFIPK